MVEQSMKTRGFGRERSSPFWIPSYVERMQSYVALTCFGSGRQVTTVSCGSQSVEAPTSRRGHVVGKKRRQFLGFSEDWLLLYNNNHGKGRQAGPT